MVIFTGLYPQPAQLDAEHPPHEDPAEEETVAPPFPLLTNPQGDMIFSTFLLLHVGHDPGPSCPKTRYSKSVLHPPQ
jgi:hypothetical protein